ncbi:MAG: ParB N-terminal domain-containing protein [Candidatus Parvarchaeota archaeon]
MMIDVEKIKVKDEYYPRELVDWHTVLTYANAMKLGAKFPNIAVGRLGREIYLIDGAHRLSAYKMLKVQQVDCDIIPIKSMNDIYKEAIKRNITNGKPLTFSEKAVAVSKLEKMGLTLEQISQYLYLPITELQKIKVEKIAKSPIGDIPIRGGIKVSNKELTVEQGEDMKDIVSNSQLHILDQLLILLQNDWLDLKNEKIREKASEIVELLREKLDRYRGIMV